MGYKNISDYGVIGNGLTLGLIGIDGSVDWMCFPFMDSPSVFAAVLDDKKGGHFTVLPAYDFDSVQNYLPRTNASKREGSIAGSAENPESRILERVICIGSAA